MVYDKEQIEQLLEGYWYREPKEDWYVDNIDINKQQMKRYHQKGYKTLFIAMDSETWHKRIRKYWHLCWMGRYS